MLLPIFVVAFILSFLSTPVVIKLYRRLGMVDTPNPKKQMTTHERPVPRGGGIPIFFSVFLTVLFFVKLDQHMIGILAGALVLTIIGIIDDRYDVNPYPRLLLLFLAAGIVVASGVGIPFLNVPFLGIVQLNEPTFSFWLLGQTRNIWIVADLFALVWIVSLSNFVNWSKGLDGQLPGIVVIAAFTIGLLSLRYSADMSQWPVIILSLITAGAYLGFLPWNFYPQKIMPGYGGGTLAGYFLAVMSILSTAKVGTLFVVLGIPLIDAGYTIVRRLISGKSPVWGDRGHLHHHLLDDLRWSKRKIACAYWLVTAILGAVALRLNSQQKFYTILSVALAIGGVLLWLTYFGQSLKQRGRSDG